MGEILIMIALAIVAAILVAGLVNMFRGTEDDRSLSNKLMRARVVFQLIAILVIAFAVFFLRD